MDRRDAETFGIPCRWVRHPATINLFKQRVLNDVHVPGEHQASLVWRRLKEAGLGDGLDVRTWKGWFAPEPRRARRDAVMELDRFVDCSIDPRRSQFPDIPPTSTCYRSLMDGGLAAALLAPTDAKDPLAALTQRALQYVPESPIHLHMDAVEALALTVGNGDVGWEKIKSIAATRIMDLLHERWSPRSGTVYLTLTPSLELHLKESDPSERERITRLFSRMTRPALDHLRRAAPRPRWSNINLDGDVPAGAVHRLLFALSMDADFLVADRFRVWALDLVSAGYAAHALAWSQRYHALGAKVTPELVFWRGFALRFLSDEEEEIVQDAVASVFEWASVPAADEALSTLIRARDWYRRWLHDLGLDVKLVSSLAHRCWREVGVTYHSRA